jgi:hypothetical protein
MLQAPRKTFYGLLSVIPVLVALPLLQLPLLQRLPLTTANAAPFTAVTEEVSTRPSSHTAWRSELYPQNWDISAKRFDQDKLIQDFSYAGYQRGEKPIPKIAGPLFNVVTQYGADPTGAADSTGAIQDAINAAEKVGGVAYLPEGTFKVSPQGESNAALVVSGKMVLRGAGKGRTFLFNASYKMRSKNIIVVQGSGANPPEGSRETTITQDLMTPVTVVPVADVTGFAVGDWITLRTDATEAFIAEHNMTDLWTGRSELLGGVNYQRQITAIDPVKRTITIDIPIRYYLKMRDGARIQKMPRFVEEVGLEEFSIGNREHPATTGWGELDYTTPGTSAHDVHGANAIIFRRARNCWMTGVNSYRPPGNATATHLLSNGVSLNTSRSITVSNCEFQRAQYGGGGGNGYMFRMSNSQECLVRDCAARYQRHGFVFLSMGSSGNVVHGGIAQFTATQVADNNKPDHRTNGRGSDHHMHLSQSNLVDGVKVDQDLFTAHYRGTFGTVHGQTSTHSVYWNMQGEGYFPGRKNIVLSEQARYGYIIGTRGPASDVQVGENPRTLPLDHVEGVGMGDHLEPQSLYLDQLRRRTGR